MKFMQGLVCALLCTGLCAVASAQTVTVGQAGDFATIQAAIDSFRSDSATTGVHSLDPANNVIRILDNATTEPTKILIPENVTKDNTSGGIVIESVAPQGYTVVLSQNSEAGVDRGTASYAISLSHVNVYNAGYVKIKGLRIIPETTDTDRPINIEAKSAVGETATIDIEDVWAMPRLGMLPATDGFTNPATVDAYFNSGEGIRFGSATSGALAFGNLKNVRVSGITGTGSRGLRLFNQGVTVGEGCVFSYCAGKGVESNQSVLNRDYYFVSFEGTEANPIYIIGNGTLGMDISTGTTSAAPTLRRVEWVRCIGNGDNGFDQSSGELLEGVSNSIFALNGGAMGNFYFYSDDDETSNTVTECTFYNATAAGAPAFAVANAGATADQWHITGSIFAGVGAASDDLLQNSGANVQLVNIANSALVTEGTASLQAGDADGLLDADVANFVLDGSVINADPLFESVDPFQTNFLYVSNGAVYSNVGGTMLRGGTAQLEVPVELSGFSIE